MFGDRKVWHAIILEFDGSSFRMKGTRRRKIPNPKNKTGGGHSAVAGQALAPPPRMGAQIAKNPITEETLHPLAEFMQRAKFVHVIASRIPEIIQPFHQFRARRHMAFS